MKRDMKLVKDVLEFIEYTVTLDGPTHSELMEEVLANHGVLGSGEAEDALLEEIIYQVTILESGGFLAKTEVEPSGDRPDEIYYQLTWAGHDLLDSINKRQYQ